MPFRKHLRLVFVMRDVEEMSIEETASHLGIRPETVKTRLHRARRLLRGAVTRQSAGVDLKETFPICQGRAVSHITEAVLSRSQKDSSL